MYATGPFAEQTLCLVRKPSTVFNYMAVPEISTWGYPRTRERPLRHAGIAGPDT